MESYENVSCDQVSYSCRFSANRTAATWRAVVWMMMTMMKMMMVLSRWRMASTKTTRPRLVSWRRNNSTSDVTSRHFRQLSNLLQLADSKVEEQSRLYHHHPAHLLCGCCCCCSGFCSEILFICYIFCRVCETWPAADVVTWRSWFAIFIQKKFCRKLFCITALMHWTAILSYMPLVFCSADG